MHVFLIIIFVVVAYYFLTKGAGSLSYKPRRKQKLRGDLIEHEAGILVALMAKVAKADGRVGELEAQLISLTLSDIANSFDNSAHVRTLLKELYNREKDDFSNTIELAQNYYEKNHSFYLKRVAVLEYLLNLAFIDGEFAHHEREIIEDIAKALHVKQSELNKIIAKFEALHVRASSQMTLIGAYKILDVEEQSDFNLIKRRYRELVKKHHPDILMGQGADKQTIEEATKKLQEINSAYEMIKKSRAE